MKQVASRRGRLFVINHLWALFFAAILGGCSFTEDTPNSMTSVRGWISAGDPISSADLTFHNALGGQIDQVQQAATSKVGSFSVSVADLTQDFRVVASGGNQQGEASVAVYSADHRNYNHETGIVYINPVTTMVSAYLDKHPGMTLDDATSIIKVFLEIPDWVDIGSGLAAPNDYFADWKFMGEALANGGVNAYINQLITELDQGGGATTHPFLSEGPLLQGAGKKIAMALAEGAATYAGGELMGWGLAQAGIGFGDSDPTGRLEAAMQNWMKDISNQLGQIQGQLDEINKKLAALSCEGKENTYGIRIHQLDTLVSNILDIQNDLAIIVADPSKANIPDPTDNRQRTPKQKIFEKIEDKLIGNEKLIPLQLEEQAGAHSLLVLFSQITKCSNRFLRSEVVNPYTQTQFDYFDKLQESLLLILVNYYHAKGEGMVDGKESHPKIDYVLKTYNDSLASQQLLVKQKMPTNTMIDKNTNLMIGNKGKNGIIDQIMITYNGMPIGAVMSLGWAGQGHFQETLDTMVNSYQFAGFADWRKATEAEITGLFSGCSVADARASMTNQGWPMPPKNIIYSNIYIGAAPYIVNDFEGFMQVEKLYFRKYDLDQCRYWYVIVDTGMSWVPGEKIDSILLAKRYLGETSWRHSDEWDHGAHWFFVRTMAANEINNYFH